MTRVRSKRGGLEGRKKEGQVVKLQIDSKTFRTLGSRLVI
jgi:hypothetical protein